MPTVLKHYIDVVTQPTLKSSFSPAMAIPATAGRLLRIALMHAGIVALKLTS